MKNYKDFKALKNYYKQSCEKWAKDQIIYMLSDWETYQSFYETREKMIETTMQFYKGRLAKDLDRCNYLASRPKVSDIYIVVTWLNKKTQMVEMWIDGFYIICNDMRALGTPTFETRLTHELDKNPKTKRMIFDLTEKALRKGMNPKDFIGYDCGTSYPRWTTLNDYKQIKQVFQKYGAKVNKETDTEQMGKRVKTMQIVF